jgi:antitoxin component of MazEF toxin-antitoxin module
MSRLPTPTKLQMAGRSMALILRKEVTNQLTWRIGDYVAVRVCGEKLVIERLAMEKIATIRTGEAQPYVNESI